MRVALLTVVFACWPAIALADPCTAPLPQHVGDTFSGIVRYVGDGDSLCVGASTNPNTWIEVRLADFNAPELHSPTGLSARAALQRIAMGHQARCVAGGGRRGNLTSYDRVVATCRLDGRRIGDLLREGDAAEGGR